MKQFILLFLFLSAEEVCKRKTNIKQIEIDDLKLMTQCQELFIEFLTVSKTWAENFRKPTLKKDAWKPKSRLDIS